MAIDFANFETDVGPVDGADGRGWEHSRCWQGGRGRVEGTPSIGFLGNGTVNEALDSSKV